ncbi:ribonuclease catalytic domain-containing protein [Synechococcus sp. W4D4]|uniref:ribonuclease catalytic domain-containing protein n=1 Tax=Synechococcus sp. W4D4 TaxID=3392294 RepID=UPI0039E7CDB9
MFNREVLAEAKPRRSAWGAAWLLLKDESEPLGLYDFCDLVCGGTEPVQLSACWLALVGGQQWFRWKQGGVHARSLEELKPLRRERRLKAIAEEAEHRWFLLLKERRPIEPSLCSELQLERIELLKKVASGRLELEGLPEAMRQSLGQLHLTQERSQLRHLLVDLGQWDPHQLVSMTGTVWSSGFSEELLKQAQQIEQNAEQEQPSDASRRDLSGQRCVTIDDEDTRDIDDGLSLEQTAAGPTRIWIHVADPGRLISAGSPLDLEARRRGSSLYLAQGNVPMFPENLSTGVFSLRAGQRTAAWSTWAELNDDGSLADYGVVRSWVKPIYRLSYEDADELIELAPPQDRDLADLEALLSRRRLWRLSQGALQMDLPEGRIRCRDGAPQLEVTEPSSSRQMVAEAMILAGAVTAQLGQDRELALPFRSQLPAELPAKTELEALPDGAVRYAAIKRCLSRGLMGTKPAAHFSLGLPAYVQATSPIRRYGDLLVQRQLAAETPLSEESLQELVNEVDGAVREGIGISREDQRHWQQVWFEAQKGQQWRAQFLRWLRPQDNLGLVRIDELAMDLAAECPSQAKPGDGLLLRVQSVDSLRDQLRLSASPF